MKTGQRGFPRGVRALPQVFGLLTYSVIGFLMESEALFSALAGRTPHATGTYPRCQDQVPVPVARFSCFGFPSSFLTVTHSRCRCLALGGPVNSRVVGGRPARVTSRPETITAHPVSDHIMVRSSIATRNGSMME